MKNSTYIRRCAIVAFAICIQLSASAFSTSKYSTVSKLATGKWVKVAVSKSGMTQITFDQLAEMGFTDPNKVRVYGQGGNLLSEQLDGTAPDDLQPVAIGISNEKIYFYANGTVKMSLNANKQMPAYTRTINHYANQAYYFLTESDDKANYIKYYSSSSAGGIYSRKTSLGYVYHETDLTSFGATGRDLFGENIIPQNGKTATDFNFYLSSPLAEEQPVTVQCAIGADASSNTTMLCTLNAQEVPFSTSSATISAISGFETYRSISATASVTPTNTFSAGKLSISFDDASNLKSAYLDYIIITYPHDNDLNGGAQMLMGYNDLSEYDKVSILDDNESLQVWNISDKANPSRMRLYTRTEYDEDLDFDITLQEFSYGKAGIGEFIAFDPSSKLYEIESYEAVANQNIHGENTPDYVIICPKELHSAAERLAQLHRNKEGMDVLVEDQDKIFNEFSSGTPDATAYRLMMKMFYDRNPQKLKYLLMFGGGYFDNRQIVRNKGDNYLLTFQSLNGDNNSLTYVSDDYFGLLEDKSGSNITSDKLCLGIGRLPVITTEEANNIVDKINRYMTNTDYSNWRNKMLIMDEFGDDDIHTYQAHNIEDLISTTTAKDLDIKRLHISAYTLVDSSTNPVYAKGINNTYAATLQLGDFLKEGVFFFTYMGHGGPTALSKKLVWKAADVKNTTLSRLPIMSLAACDIANYDSNTRGIGEYMIITPDHGCIALLTSTRTVEATENDQLNRAFIKALFTLNDNGTERTLGEAYMAAKQSYGTTASRNKMCYTLFADPALMPNYPKSNIKANVTSGTSDNNVTIIKPMTKITIEGSVCTSSGEVDTSFNGDATISLYDAQKFFKNVTYYSKSVDIFHNRPLLNETSTKVTDGKFTASFIAPKYCTADSTGIIKIYAHSVDNKTLQATTISSIKFGEYDETDDATIFDNVPPVISKMYINAIEDLDTKILESLDASGCTAFQKIRY